MSEKFFSIKQNGSGDYREKGSKFFGFAFYVENENEVKERMADLKKEYYDARHHCYAYRLGTDSLYERANDDGEPGHSAGDPILGQIKSHELTGVTHLKVRG